LTDHFAKDLLGKPANSAILQRLKTEVAGFPSAPGLAVILVGNNPASQLYVNNKKQACEAIGIRSFEYLLDADVDEQDLASLIETLNADTQVDGILLQLPLPKGMDESRLLSLISPDKDVDGFHPFNVGRLLLGLPTLRSCTPYGVWELLKYYEIDPSGKHVVIVGRSNIVGKPLAAILMQNQPFANATVTVVHSRTENLIQFTRQADILVAAIGKPLMITAEMVNPGAVVIDVGINRVSDDAHPKGFRVVGDVYYDEVRHVASAITPVPGGVGPMTIAMLMSNTVNAYQLRRKNNKGD